MQGRIVAYLPGYSTHRTHPYDIRSAPADELTHLVYAFAGFARQGSDWIAAYPEPDDPANNLPALGELKQRWPHLKLLISIGGYTNSQEVDPSGSRIFSVIAASAQARQVFVSSCLDLFFKSSMLKGPPWTSLFDGIDVDWEYPKTTADQHNYTLLLQEFRRQLDVAGHRTGSSYDLTIAYNMIPRHIELGAVASCVSWFNLMAYEAHEPQANHVGLVTDFNSPLYPSPQEPNATWNIHDAVQNNWLAAPFAVPADQLVLGVSAIARTYAGVKNVGHGVYQGYTGPGPGQFGALAYKDLVSQYEPTYESHWDPVTHSAYLYGPSDRVWMSFDNPQSVRDKAAYANQLKLGGMMLWELSADVTDVPLGPPGPSLVATMRANLHR